MSGAGIVFVFLLFALACPLVLYALVQAERDQSRTTSRADAEHIARRDTDEDDR